MLVNDIDFLTPDFLIKDDKGQFSEIPLRHWLRINTSYAKSIKSKTLKMVKGADTKLENGITQDKKLALLYIYNNISFRQYLFERQIKKFRELIDEKKIFKEKEKIFVPISFDYLTLTLYEKEFYKTKSTEEDINQFLNDIGYESDKEHHTNTTEEVEKIRKNDFTLHLWPRLLHDLSHFDELNKSTQELVLVVASCFHTIYFYLKVGTYFIDNYPVLREYFKYSIKEDEYEESSDKKVHKNTVLVQGWQSFFEELKVFAETTLESGVNESTEKQWENFIEQSSYLSDWVKQEAIDIVDEIESFIDNSITPILVQFDDNDDVQTFESSLPLIWCKELLSHINDEEAFHGLIEQIDKKIGICLELSSELRDTKEVLVPFERELDLDSLVYTERKKQKNKLRMLKEQVDELIGDILENIKPDSYSLDDIEELEELNLDSYAQSTYFKGFQSPLEELLKKYSEALEEPVTDNKQALTEELKDTSSEDEQRIKEKKHQEINEDSISESETEIIDVIEKKQSPEPESELEPEIIPVQEPETELESEPDVIGQTDEDVIISNEMPDEETIDDDELLEGEQLFDEQVIDISENNQNVIANIKGFLQNESSLPGILIDNIGLNFILKKDLSSAYHIINAIDDSIYSNTHYLSRQLIKVAYFAENVWNPNGQIFKYVRSMLYGLQPSDLTDVNQKGIERILPFLGFKATFQPTLFGGYRSNAAIFLKSIKDLFDIDEVKLLIEEVIELADHNIKVSLNALRDQEQPSDNNTHKIIDEAIQWRELIFDSNKGFAPTRRFLRYLVESGEYKKVYHIVINNEEKESKQVYDFVDKFSDPDQLTRLFNATDKQFDDMYIQKNRKYAINLFTRQSMEFIRIAHRWLESIEQENPNQVEITKSFTARFIKILHKTHDVIEHKIKVLDETCLTRKVGYELIQRNIFNLIETIDHNKAQSIWPEEFVDVSFNRALKLADPKQEKESSELILSLSSNLLSDHNSQEVFYQSLENGLYDLAYVSMEKLKLAGQNTEELYDKYIKERDKAVENIASLIDQVQNLTDNAILSEIMDENEAHNDRDILTNYREEVVEGKLNNLLDLRSIKTELQNRKSELESKFDASRGRLIERYNESIEAARSKNLVGDSFTALVEQAIEENNLTVLEEFIEELENSITENKSIDIDKEPSLFPVLNFKECADELYEFVSNSNNTNSLKSQIKDQFSRSIPVSDDEATSLKWMMSTSKLSNKMNQSWYIEHIRLLKVLGFSLKHDVYTDHIGKLTNYRTSSSFSQMELLFQRPSDFVKCFSFVRTDFQESKIILTIATPWEANTLKEYLDNNVILESTIIVISLYPLNQKERKAFANYCKSHSRTILLIDPVFLLYLIANKEQYIAFQPVRTYLHLAAAYTYHNPYTGDRLDPPPEEMRFGRENEIRQLLDYSSGAAIIFGGRQLGKSTILQGVESNFRNPERHQYVLAYKVDGSVISEDNWLKFGMYREWNTIFDFFIQSKLIEPSKEKPEIHDIKSQIKACFNNNKHLRTIVIIDEVDTLLNIDSAKDFPFIRELRDLVDSTKNRFKVIICGLQNVKRFDTSPNNPLKQLGKSLAVGIMSTSDALNLIKTPMEALGYKFESPLVANRILALTNRHPGLLQVFCYHLVDYLKNKKNLNNPIGDYRITDNDVAQIYKHKDVRDVIKDRFAITLHLDVRYAIIIYSLVLREYGQQKFSVAVAQNTAGEWLEPLKGMSQKQFNAILDELVGLGVLRKDEQYYAIRNTSVLKLLGTPKEIEDSILSEIDHYESNDPLEYHRINTQNNRTIPSPLTRRDEELIIGVAQNDSKKFNELNAITDYLKTSTVSVVSGSNALGLFALKDSLSGLYNRDNPMNVDSRISQYSVDSFNLKKYPKFKQFEIRLKKLNDEVSDQPKILLIECDGKKSASEIDTYIDYALSQTKELDKKTHPSRIIFVFQPLDIWHWLNYSVGETKQEAMTFIRLAKWNQSALKAHLSYFDLNDRIEKSRAFEEFSRGWYQPTYFIGRKRDKYKTDDYKKICEKENISAFSEKEANKFISFTGIDSLPWVRSLLKELSIYSQGELDYGTIETVISYLSDDYELNSDDTDKVIDWLSQLCIITGKVNRHDDINEKYYVIDEYVKKYLSD